MFATLSVLALAACSVSASFVGINPNALNVPLDEARVAIEKNHQLIQQASEGARNILGGGVPLALPADTHEVAAGKRAHAVAHATQAALTRGHGVWAAAPLAAVAPLAAAPVAAVAPVARVAAVAPAAVLAAPAWGIGHGVVESAPLGLALSRAGPLHLAAPHGIDGIALGGLGYGLGLGHGLGHGKGLWL